MHRSVLAAAAVAVIGAVPVLAAAAQGANGHDELRAVRDSTALFRSVAVAERAGYA